MNSRGGGAGGGGKPRPAAGCTQQECYSPRFLQKVCRAGRVLGEGGPEGKQLLFEGGGRCTVSSERHSPQLQLEAANVNHGQLAQLARGRYSTTQKRPALILRTCIRLERSLGGPLCASGSCRWKEKTLGPYWLPT